MTNDKLESLIILKEKIEQLERVISDDEILHIGNSNQNKHDYYNTRRGSCLHEGIRSLLMKELEASKMQFEQY